MSMDRDDPNHYLNREQLYDDLNHIAEDDDLGWKFSRHLYPTLCGFSSDRCHLIHQMDRGDILAEVTCESCILILLSQRAEKDHVEQEDSQSPLGPKS